jgi:hypothetical protein
MFASAVRWEWILAQRGEVMTRGRAGGQERCGARLRHAGDVCRYRKPPSKKSAATTTANPATIEINPGLPYKLPVEYAAAPKTTIIATKITRLSAAALSCSQGARRRGIYNCHSRSPLFISASSGFGSVRYLSVSWYVRFGRTGLPNSSRREQYDGSIIGA